MQKILFNIAQEYYWTSLKPVYEQFAVDENCECYLKIGKNHKRFLYLFLIPQKNDIERKLKKEGYRITDEFKGFDVVFCGSPLKKPHKYKDAILCNVDHGPGIKTLRYRNFLKQPKTRYVCFVEGQYRIDKFKKYGLDKLEKIYDVGLPKLDVFFNGTYKKDKLIEEYDLDPNKKIILYAPSYKPTSIFMMGEKVTSLSGEYNVIVKLHPYSWTGKYASHSQHKLFENLEVKYPNFHLVPSDKHNILPYIFIADTMISDGSSVINEFLALEKCGIIVDLPDNKLTHHDGEPLLEDKSSEWLKGSFVHISSEKEVENAVETALNPSKERKKNIKKAKDYIFSYTDGKSAQRVKQVTEKLIKER
ncbi:MAG: CDP-glycerol glycerophosphotransferase family protein [Candidatus Cloacimonetes bacterium]|nr:CDP-glycerol glycerophosphotransferase family protein [Candidatus Cloacimonadota bacterium]